MTADDLSAHPRYLLLAGALAMAGLLTALVYHVWFTPYTMVLFMMAGQGLILLAAGCFLYAVWSGVRARLRSIVEKKFKAGEIVFRQGDRADRLYVIGKGEVEVVRETPGKEDVGAGAARRRTVLRRDRDSRRHAADGHRAGGHRRRGAEHPPQLLHVAVLVPADAPRERGAIRFKRRG